MLELLFLLLPIAAGYGWYMGRRSLTQNRQKQSNKLTRDYVTGLNFLLSDQPDKAVDLFIDLLQVDSETIETHLALGNLFRQRGEVDRAIRIHQNLIARPSLTREQKNLALLQLAKDFTAAGLLDRSEKIFRQLIDEPDHKIAALQQLLTIYQQTKEWLSAIDVAEKLLAANSDKVAVANVKKDIAHFYCELSCEFLKQDKKKKSLSLLKKALVIDRKCVRASLALADIHINDGNIRSALKPLEQVLAQDVDFVSEVLSRLDDCYRQLGDDAGIVTFLDEALQKGAGASAGLMMADKAARSQGVESAETLVVKQLMRNPTMKGFHRLMEYHLELAEEGRAKDSLEMLRKLVAEQLKLRPNFRCRKCGFSTKSVYWHCPSCKSWGSVKPIRGLDGE